MDLYDYIYVLMDELAETTDMTHDEIMDYLHELEIQDGTTNIVWG